MVYYEIHYLLLSILSTQDISHKKKLRKNIEEIKKKLLKSLVEERLENA